MTAPHAPHVTSCTLHIIYLLIQAALDEATEPWGIKVERVEM